MVANLKTVEQIVKIMLKHVDHKTALRMTRDLHNHVDGTKSVTDTFSRIAEKLIDKDAENANV